MKLLCKGNWYRSLKLNEGRRCTAVHFDISNLDFGTASLIFSRRAILNQFAMVEFNFSSHKLIMSHIY
jgi:hypothetical protein